jgi:hypothetical protein
VRPVTRSAWTTQMSQIAARRDAGNLRPPEKAKRLRI